MAANDFASRYFELTQQSPYVRAVARPGQVIVKMMPYEYGVVIGPTLTIGGAPLTALMTTLADSDFVLTSLSASVQLTVNGDMKYNRNVTLQIQDTSTGKYFFSAPTVMSLVAGAGGFPFIFPAPRVIRPNTSLLVSAQNRDTAVAYYQMFVTFGGSRIFYAGEHGNG